MTVSTAGKTPHQILLEFRDRYQPDIILFIREVLKAEPHAWHLEALEQYNARARRISIRSGHGVGKTCLLAWMMLHHLIFRYPQKTQVTAPTEKQLFNALWPEFKKWTKKFVAFGKEPNKPGPFEGLIEVKSDRAELIAAPESSFISCATSRAETPEALAGVHCDPGYVLLIGDEASGVPEQVFEAAAGSMSGHNAMTVLAGNPVRGQGFFFDTHGKLADMWWTKKVACQDVPEQVTEDFIEDIKRRYGENSNAYRIRVLGEFPVSDDDTVIPFDLVELALTRDVSTSKTAPVVWGVDCARFGRDRSALAKRQANRLIEPVRYWTKLDSMELAARIKLEWDECPANIRPAEINIDVIGWGAGTVDRLRELGLPARGINTSESPATTEAQRYANLKAELWFAARQWFANRDCKLPEQYANRADRHVADLVEELTKPKYRFRKGSQKIEVESKDELKRRGMDSPDLADAFVLTFASTAITLAFGRAASTSWNRPISRIIKSVV